MGIIVSEIVLHKPGFLIEILAGEAEGIDFCRIAFHLENIPIRAVFVQGSPARLDAEERRRVLQRVMRIIKIFHISSRFIKDAHRQDARGYRFQGIPQVRFTQDGFSGFRSVRSIQFRDLQVTLVDKPFP